MRISAVQVYFTLVQPGLFKLCVTSTFDHKVPTLPLSWILTMNVSFERWIISHVESKTLYKSMQYITVTYTLYCFGWILCVSSNWQKLILPRYLQKQRRGILTLLTVTITGRVSARKHCLKKQILTKEWPAQGEIVPGDGDSSDSAPAFASVFDQVQLLKSRICIVPQTREEKEIRNHVDAEVNK